MSEKMTSPALNELRAGPELDALVAEKVMGWTLSARIGYGWPVSVKMPGMSVPACKHPAYSTDIADAWSVVEKMRKTHLFSIRDDARDDEAFYVSFEDEKGLSAATADTAPHAICLAALLAVGKASR